MPGGDRLPEPLDDMGQRRNVSLRGVGLAELAAGFDPQQAPPQRSPRVTRLGGEGQHAVCRLQADVYAVGSGAGHLARPEGAGQSVRGGGGLGQLEGALAERLGLVGSIAGKGEAVRRRESGCQTGAQL